MTLEVRTLKFKKLALINGLGSIPIVALCVAFAFYFSTPAPLIFILPLFIALVLLGHKLSTKTSQININKDVISIDDLTINRKSFSNYFLNEYGTGMIRLELIQNDGKIYTIDYKSWGKNERSFKLFFNELDSIKNENCINQIKPEYMGMHMKQVKSMLPVIYILMGVVILIDLWWVYSKLSNTETPPTYKFLVVNAAFAYFIPYLIRLKKK